MEAWQIACSRTVNIGLDPASDSEPSGLKSLPMDDDEVTVPTGAPACYCRVNHIESLSIMRMHGSTTEGRQNSPVIVMLLDA